MKHKCFIGLTRFLILGMALIMNVSPGFGQGNIHMGRILITPKFALQGEYNDNIYSAPKESKNEDFIFKLTPGLMLNYTGAQPGNTFMMGYDVELAAYSKKNNNNYQKHQPYLSLGVKTPSGVFFNMSERYVKTADPYGAENSYKLGTKTRRMENTLDFTLGYRYSTYSVETLVQRYFTRYDAIADQWQDRTDNKIGFSFFIKPTPAEKLSFLVQYRMTSADYDKQNDTNKAISSGGNNWKSSTSQNYKLNDYLVGIRFEPGGKLTGDAKIGYSDKQFDNEKDVNGSKYSDANTWIIETTLFFNMSQKTNLEFFFNRSIQGSPDMDAASFVDTNIGGKVRHKLVERVSLNGGLKWGNSDYRDEYGDKPNKFYNSYEFSMGADYSIQQWLQTGVAYQYKTKNSSHSKYSSSEYDINILSFDLKAAF